MSEPRVCVIAIDGNEDSEYTLSWYKRHLHKNGDKAVLVFVPEYQGLLHASKWENTVYVLSRDSEAMTGDEQDRMKSDLLKFAEKLLHLGIEGKVKYVIAARPEEGILRVAEEENAEMIVVGSCGRGSLHRKFLDSVSDFLLHHASCPVIVCKRPLKTDSEPFFEEHKLDSSHITDVSRESSEDSEEMVHK